MSGAYSVIISVSSARLLINAWKSAIEPLATDLVNFAVPDTV